MKYKDFSGTTGVIIGTGPSLTGEQVDYIAEKRAAGECRVFGVNNAYKIAPFLDAFLACNIEWWDFYADEAQFEQFRFSYFNGDPNADMWTWDKHTARAYEINHVWGKWGNSFSTNPEFIHYGHGAGFQVLNLAYHYGIRNFVLVGYDMRYLPGYNRGSKKPGQGRHFFGEYPKSMQHWPRVGKEGEFTGLLKTFKTIDTRALGINIVNCSPGSAMDFFETAELKDAL